MSMYNRNRIGNIGKVKYFLPGSRTKQARLAKSQIESRNQTRKQSTLEVEEDAKCGPINLSSFSKNDVSFEVLGVSDVSVEPVQQKKSEQKNKIFSMFPQGKQRQQFLKFVEGLKNDQNYQNTVTMFTIMYYYEKKTGQKMNTFL